MNVAVTGAHGFIGGAVVRQLEAKGHQVVHVDRQTGTDILTADLAEVMASCETVIHLAGMLGTAELFDQVEEAVDVNVLGTVRVLEACATIGAGYVGITMPPVFPSVYTATKVCAHRLADAWHHAHQVPVTHIRPFNVYGPGQAWGPGHPQKILPTFASRSWAGQAMPVWGDGAQCVDMVHVDDVAENLAWAATQEGPFGRCEVYDAGTGHPATVLDVALRVAAVTGSGLVEFLPMRPGEIPQDSLVATEFGPFTPAAPWDRFQEAVRTYQPPGRER